MTPSDLRQLAATLDAGVTCRDDHQGDDTFVSELLEIARETGAPRTRILRVVADALDANIELEREAMIAAASARHSALVLTALPVFTLIVTELFGMHALGFLLGAPIGWLCLAIGVGASYGGWKWMDRLRRRIPTPSPATGILGDVVAEILSVTGIRNDIENALCASGERWGVGSEWTSIVDIRASARETGIPVSGLIRADSHERRRSSRFSVREAIERLPGQMLIPLGVCLFPAFVVLTVVPAVAAMAQGFFRTSS
jgi:tight adherence protein B